MTGQKNSDRKITPKELNYISKYVNALKIYKKIFIWVLCALIISGDFVYLVYTLNKGFDALIFTLTLIGNAAIIWFIYFLIKSTKSQEEKFQQVQVITGKYKEDYSKPHVVERYIGNKKIILPNKWNKVVNNGEQAIAEVYPANILGLNITSIKEHYFVLSLNNELYIDPVVKEK